MAGLVAEFTDQKFETEVLKAAGPVLVDFWAPWCGPCRMIAPMIDDLSKEYQGSITIGKINIDDNPETANQFGISSIPTLMLFKNGEIVDRFVGVPPKPRLQAALDAAKG